MKKLIGFFTILFFLVIFNGTKPASATEISINKMNETITWRKTVETTDIMYYAICSSASTGSVSSSKLYELNSDSTQFYFDYSTLSNTKNHYVGYVYGEPDFTARNIQLHGVVTIPAGYKKLTIRLAYDDEEANNLFYKMYSVVLQNQKGESKSYEQVVDYYNTTDSYGNIKRQRFVSLRDAEGYSLSGNFQYRKGVNGSWCAYNDSSLAVTFEQMKVSGSTVYIRIAPSDTGSFRYTKEVKIKIPQKAKAPTIKQDMKKSTLAIKNGMQVSQDRKNWTTILPYKNKAQTGITYTKEYDLNQVTGNKISGVSPDSLVRSTGLYPRDGSYTFYVRIAPTMTKAASNITKLTMPVPPVLEAKNLSVTVNNDTANTIFTVANLEFTGKLQYIITEAIDQYPELLDMTKAKWAAFEPNQLQIVSMKGRKGPAYTLLNGEKRQVANVSYGHNLILRIAPTDTAFASNCIVIPLLKPVPTPTPVL